MGRETNRNLRNRRRKQAIKNRLRQLTKQQKKTARPATAKARPPAAT
jgi:hypothetical protein